MYIFKFIDGKPGGKSGSPGMEVDGVSHAYQVIGLIKSGEDQVVANYPAK